MSVLVGGAYQARYRVPDAAGEVTVTLTVTAPDGSITHPALPAVTSGFTIDVPVPATMPGAYLLVWQTTGAVIDALQDQFNAVAPQLQLASLSDLRDELNISPHEHERDRKLRRYLEQASGIIENITGPIRHQQRTDFFDGPGTDVVLPFRWVHALTNVYEVRGTYIYTLTEQPLGQSIDSYGYTWDRTTNTVTRRAYGGATALFPPGERVVCVTYTLGFDAIPEEISRAATELISHWMHFEQTAFRSPFQAEPDEEAPITMADYFVPNGVIEKLQRYQRAPGIF